MNPDHHKYATLPDTPSLAVGQTSTSFGSRVSDADDDIADEELPIRHSRMSTGLLTAFCGIRCTDPLALFVIFPYVNEMLLEYGIATDARSTGYTAGILEASLAFPNAVGIPIWIYVANTYGRRPAMIPSTVACALVGATFGFTKAYLAMIVIRIMTGVLNGQSAIAKTYLAEIADADNQAFAFSLMSLSWQVSWCFSATSGGFLSHPERLFPATASIGLLQQYPYVLPPIVVAVPSMLAAILGYYTLAETLPSTASKYGPKIKSNASPAPSLIESVRQWSPNMRSVCFLWTLMVFINIYLQSAIPLFLFAPVDAGGMGLGTGAIGNYFMVRAVTIVLIEMPLYPRFHKRFGTITLLRGQIAIYVVNFVLVPCVSLVRRQSSSKEHLDWTSISGLALVLLLDVTGQTMFISGDLMCTNAAPIKEAQSSFNAMMELDAKVFQVVAAWLASWLFAYSAETQIMNGYLVWFAVWFVALYAFYTVYHFEEGKGWRHADVTMRQTETLMSPMTSM